VTWEEGTWAAWLYDLLQPQVQHIVVCNPRRNALLKEGSMESGNQAVRETVRPSEGRFQ
jgi:molybdopterin-guanine dinucleotide biosynthesis protein A